MADGISSVVLERKTRKTEAEGFMRSEHIVGKHVKNMEGYDLGEIAGMWVGLLRGRVEYAVLACTAAAGGNCLPFRSRLSPTGQGTMSSW